MKKYLLIVLLLSFVVTSNAQLAPHKYLIKFADKNNSPYSITNPSQFLSAKAIARRTHQGITIKYNDLPVSPAYIDSIVSTGVTILCNSKWFNSVTIYTTDSLALLKIHSFPFVISVDSVAKVNFNVIKSFIPKKLETSDINLICKLNNNISVEDKKYNSYYDYGFAYNQINMIGGNYLHNIGYKGQGMTIAIIDAGFSNVDTLSAFDSLWNNNHILGTKDFVEPGGNVFLQHSHGMMVLSIMGANIPGQIVGTAPEANFWLLRSEDAYSEYIIEEYNWASAAEFADSAGADVINSSLGYSTFNAAWMDHTYADMDGHTCPASIAASIAASKGMIVCVSAGNSGQSTWHYIGAPADADSILTVGAVDSLKVYANFSSKGPSYDGRIKPTVATQGEGTWVISSSGTPMPGNGTSFSSPVLAGAVTCLWQAFPLMTNSQIIDAIKKSSSQYLNPDSLLGYGIPNFVAAYMILSEVKINDFNNNNTVNVFPNPFNDIIYLLFFSSDTEYINIEIYDITGKKVYSEPELHRSYGYNYFSVGKVSGLSKGLYFLRIYSKDNSFTKKIMKIE